MWVASSPFFWSTGSYAFFWELCLSHSCSPGSTGTLSHDTLDALFHLSAGWQCGFRTPLLQIFLLSGRSSLRRDWRSDVTLSSDATLNYAFHHSHHDGLGEQTRTLWRRMVGGSRPTPLSSWCERGSNLRRAADCVWHLLRLRSLNALLGELVIAPFCWVDLEGVLPCLILYWIYCPLFRGGPWCPTFLAVSSTSILYNGVTSTPNPFHRTPFYFWEIRYLY